VDAPRLPHGEIVVSSYSRWGKSIPSTHSASTGSVTYVLVDDGGAGHTIGCDSTGLLLSIHT